MSYMDKLRRSGYDKRHFEISQLIEICDVLHVQTLFHVRSIRPSRSSTRSIRAQQRCLDRNVEQSVSRCKIDGSSNERLILGMRTRVHALYISSAEAGTVAKKANRV